LVLSFELPIGGGVSGLGPCCASLGRVSFVALNNAASGAIVIVVSPCPRNSRSTTSGTGARYPVSICLDVKAALGNENGNVPLHVTALEQRVRNRLRPLLPALDARIGRASVPKKMNFPPGLKNVQYLDGLHDAGDLHR